MKPYFIYFYDVQEQRVSYESGYDAYVMSAKDPIDALRQHYRVVNGNNGTGSYFRTTAIYEAVCALT